MHKTYSFSQRSVLIIITVFCAPPITDYLIEGAQRTLAINAIVTARRHDPQRTQKNKNIRKIKKKNFCPSWTRTDGQKSPSTSPI